MAGRTAREAGPARDLAAGNAAPRSRLGRWICLPLWLLAAAGCGGSAEERLAEARQGLADAAYSDSLAAAEAGLALEPDALTHWGLSLVKLESHARAGDGEAALAELRGLMDRFPNRIPVTQYSATAGQLRVAGAGGAAVEVLDLGLKRHPEHPDLERLIGAASQAGTDSAELEMLRSLGYVE